MVSHTLTRAMATLVTLAAILYFLSAPPNLLSQMNMGSVYGTVTDQSGAVIPGAKVTAVNQGTGLSRVTLSGNTGQFRIPDLPVGAYTITAEARGFKLYSQSTVTVVVSQPTLANIALQVGSVAQHVVVSANPVAQVQLYQSTVGGVLQEQAVNNLPLNGRNFIQLSYLAPGVTVNYAPITLKGSPADVPGGVAVMPYVNGARNTMNAVLIDGASDNDPVLNTAAIVPVPDAIEEFKVQTNMYTAQYGHGGGSIINIVTKSGTSHVHGDAYYYGRNEALDARNSFLANRPTLRRHQFGVALGGPVKIGGLGKDTFIFGNYEGFRQEAGEILNTVVPTALQREGNFSNLSTPLKDPIGGCISGNIINPSCMDPVAVGVMNKLWPLPNVGTNLYQAAPITTLNHDQFLIKVDHSGKRHTLSGRYAFDDGREFVPVAGAAGAGISVGSGAPGFPVTNPMRAQDFAFSDTFIASDRLVNIARFTFLHDTFADNLLVSHGSPAAFGFTYPVTQDPSMPSFSVFGIGPAGTPAQKDFTKDNNIFQWADDVSYQKGSHFMHIGVEVDRSMVDVNTGNFTPGLFDFSGAVTGNAFADYLFGAPLLFLQVEGDPIRNFRDSTYSAYFQDAYRMRPNFTLNYGLRWDVFTPFTDPNIYSIGHPRLATFIPGQKSTYDPSLPTGVVLAGYDKGVRQGIIATDYNGFQPRIGLAWDPTGHGTTSIRAGYGIFDDATALDGTINSTDGTPGIRPAEAPFLPGVHAMADPYFGKSPFTPPITFPIPTVPPLSPTFVDPNNRTAYVQQWNLTVQRQIPWSMLFQIGYVGTEGTKLTGPLSLAQSCLATPAQPCNGQTTNTVANESARLPYPGLSGLLMFTSQYSSNYNGLQAELTRAMQNGFEYQLSYTFSKVIDYTSMNDFAYSILGQVQPQNSYNLGAEYGLAAFNTPNRFVANFMYQLPFAKSGTGVVKYLAGNWQVNGILTFQSGSPFTVYDSSDPSLTNSSGDRPNAVCNPNSSHHTVQEWFNTACFQRISPGGGFGNAGRNITFTDGVKTLDFSVFKTFVTSEATRLELRGEVYNLFNTPIYSIPVSDINSQLFGQVLGTAVPERQIQLVLKFFF
ncbi:MAG TPA: TonB-dependent receptor [Terriglobia bacterium]|nr:TonB-dependent receptor [Terriglobia bacterium]